VVTQKIYLSTNLSNMLVSDLANQFTLDDFPDSPFDPKSGSHR
jgi:hypothetical protein